jgi:arylsulfatase A-like enzyme
MIADGSVQSYLLPLETEGASGDACCRFGVAVGTHEPGSIDILSVRVVSREAAFAGDSLGVMTVVDGSKEHRRTLFTRTPGRVAFTVRVPPGGRLDVGLGVVSDAAPVDFRVTVTSKGQQEEESLLEETLADKAAWAQRSVDLSTFEGQTVTLALQADAEMPGTVALWAAPTLTSSQASGKPNVIFYVIDGAGADWMSLYGYNRRTTPFLERLAGEAVVFENAYSNATSTPLSTPSYMTSLLYSSIDRFGSLSNKIPDGVTTMAEHFGKTGYQTGVFVSNPFAATMSGLERGVDVVRVLDPPVPAVSSEHLHRTFWDWRDAYPGTPYWAHFQTTDVHEPFRPMAPFSGLFITPELRAQYIEWDETVRWWDTRSYAPAGITVAQHALAQQALYDEGMAHQDHHLERFVARLKAEGRWENTILVIASDHGYPAGSHRLMPGIAIDAPYIHPFATRVPLMFVWPGHMEGGRRIRTPVSMIDVLPTLLDLAGLPQPQMRQGQSLAPLLLGQVTEVEWEPHPVWVDVLVSDEISGDLVGNIEVIDGRWGASLCVRPDDPNAEVRPANTGDALRDCTQSVLDPRAMRPVPRERLLVYDLWDDPLLERPINQERPDLVEKYTKLLEAQVEANAALRELIAGRGQAVELSPEDLEQLRTLGYIQ